MSKMLENDEILLRALEPEDLDILYEWENDTELWKYGATLAPYSRFALRQYISDAQQDIYQTKQLRLMIELKETKKAIGTIDLYDFDAHNKRAGVGILIDKTHRLLGYGAQALSLIETYGFGFLKLKQLYAFVPVKNQRSVNLFQKVGYVTSGTLESWLSVQQSFEDVLILQLINRFN